MDHNLPLKLKIIQANINRSKASLHDLIDVSVNNNIDIAVVQEPYTSNVKELRVSGHQVIQRLTSDVVKSAIIIFNKDVSAFLQTQYSTSNITTIDIKFHSLKFRLINCYNVPNEDISNNLTIISQAVDDADGGLQGAVLTGDFNSHHNFWDHNHANDKNGVILHDFIVSKSMDVMNDNQKPTFEVIRNGRLITSIIDLTIASRNLITKISDWEVNSSLIANSDHNAITFSITSELTNDPNPIISTFKYKTSRAKWEDFEATLESELARRNINSDRIQSVTNLTGLDLLVAGLTKSIQVACDKSIPKFRRRLKKCPWMTDEINEQKKRVIYLKHKLQNSGRRGGRGHEEAVNTFAREKEKYANTLSKASVNSFKKYLQDQGRGDVWSRIKPIITNKPNVKPPSSLCVNGNFTKSPRETGQALLQHFYPDDHPSTDTPSQQLLRNLDDTYYRSPDEPSFTQDEVIWVFKNMSPKKAPGLDHLTSDVVLRFAKSHTSLLTDLYNKCLTLGLFPTKWKRALVKVLPKPGKPNYETLKSFRPIGLLPVLGKGLESLIKSRLSDDLHKRKQLSSQQYGFTEQTSTSDAIRSAVNHIKRMKRDEKHVLAVSLDINGAFDHAWWPALMSGLRNREVKSNIYRLIKHYFEDRYVQLPICDVTAEKITTQGCIQGSVTGPLYWNIILDDLLSISLPSNIKIQAFADDVLVIAADSDPVALERSVNDILRKVGEWGRDVKLDFGPEKTQVVGFNETARRINLVMNNVPIQQSDEMKYLGVIIDWKLKFTNHVRYVIQKAQHTYKFITRIARPTWGVKSEIIKIIYERAIEPIVTYACNVWRGALNNKYIRKELNTFQRPYALCVSKAFHTFSTNGALALADLIPVDLRIIELAELEDVKLQNTTRFLPSDRQYQNRIRFTERDHPSITFKSNWKEVVSQEVSLTYERSSDLSIYTDGSKLDHKVGSAFVIKNHHSTVKIKRLRLESYCSVFQAELIAIKESLTYLFTSRSTNVKTCLFTDSLSAIKAIDNRKNSNPIVHDIHQILAKLQSRNVLVQILWTKAHVGIEGNEVADSLAKQATTSHARPIYDKFPLSYVKRMIRQDTLNKWNSRFIDAPQGKDLKKFIPNIFQSHKFFKECGARFETTQILGGHAFNLTYLKRFHIKSQDVCPCGSNTPQTIEHLLYDCPRFIHERREFENVCSEYKVNPKQFPDVMCKRETLESFLWTC